ncbi:MAG: TRAP transporter substrate-binding protein DctP [Gammaproteobacteria bacterium]|nr:TRAP transporter substrate-binding protein DctP [Gammaproteobacteria bacterium]
MRSYSRWVRHFITCIGCCLVLSVSLPVMAEKTYELKFATLAPVGSTWSDLLQEWADEVKARSDGRLIFKIYPGGVQGDEPDVLKKIRFGQLHGGAFTGYGIGHIYSPARALELPFLYNDIDEIDFVRERFMEEIEQGYRDNGYEMLGWMEVGFIYFFSREPIRSLDDLQERRIWHWQGDPIGKAFFDASGIAPVPLSIIDVYTSLSTGLIDTVYCPPLGAIALQWFTKTRYVTNVPMANGIGSLIVSRRFYQNLPQDLQKLLKSTGQDIGAKLVAATRKDNQDSLDVLRSKGMEFVLNPEDLDEAQVKDISTKAAQSLMDSGYIPEATIDRIQQWLAEYRADKEQQESIDAVP